MTKLYISILIQYLINLWGVLYKTPLKAETNSQQ